jgi:hypothetical protein
VSVKVPSSLPIPFRFGEIPLDRTNPAPNPSPACAPPYPRLGDKRHRSMISGPVCSRGADLEAGRGLGGREAAPDRIRLRRSLEPP